MLRSWMNFSRTVFQHKPKILQLFKPNFAARQNYCQTALAPNLLVTRRPSKKKTHLSPVEDEKVKAMGSMYKVWAYATAESYDMESLKSELLKQGVYSLLANPEDMHGVIRVTAAYPTTNVAKQILFFSDGAVVFWNIQIIEIRQVLSMLAHHQEDAYEASIVRHESEDMDYYFADHVTQSKLSNGRIVMPTNEENDLAKYAFSNAIAMSVKLAIWESSLESYIESMKWVVDNMKEGKRLEISKQQVMRKTGQLFALQHLINLGSNLLDEPDFYWDREHLEPLYKQMSAFFNIQRRTKVMNEKLSHCSKLTDLLSSHLNDKHHVRLEWFIIILIAVEIVFEFIHFADRFL